MLCLLLTAISYLERIFETIDEPVLVKDAEGATEMPAIKGQVEFKDVCFTQGKVVQDRVHPGFSVIAA